MGRGRNLTSGSFGERCHKQIRVICAELREVKTMHSKFSAKEDDSFSHPSYSLDVGTDDFNILGPVKYALRGRRFSADDELKFRVREELRRFRKEFYGTSIQRLKQRSKKFVNNEKDLVEK